MRIDKIVERLMIDGRLGEREAGIRTCGTTRHHQKDLSSSSSRIGMPVDLAAVALATMNLSNYLSMGSTRIPRFMLLEEMRNTAKSVEIIVKVNEM